MSALALGLPRSWGPVRCSRAARAPLLRCPQTPSACSSALALGLPRSWGPVRCSRAARAALLRCPQTNTRAAPAARCSSALALGLPPLRTSTCSSSCRRSRVTALARLGGERELGGREAERLLRVRRVDTLHLEQHAPGLHHRHPDLRRALALAHTG